MDINPASMNESQLQRNFNSPLSIWENLKRNTTAHGITHVDSAQGPVKKGFWGVLVLFTVSFLTYHTYTVFSAFFSYDISVDVKVVTDRELLFPAITVCNVNPIKNSALEEKAGDNDLLAGLLSDAARRKKKKRRKKRALILSTADDTCSSAGQIHTESGFCYGVWDSSSVESMDGKSTAQDTCESVGSLALINSQSKVDFLSASSIFDGFSGSYDNGYWINMQGAAWMDTVPLDSFTNWDSGEPTSTSNKDCTASQLPSHLWTTIDCKNNNIPLCQRLVQCPSPVYSDTGNSLDYCFFLADPTLEARWVHGEALCAAADVAGTSTLAVLDTEAKCQHVQDSGLFSGSHTYWINLKDSQWEGTTALGAWSRWDGAQGSTGCGMVHVSTGHLWTNENCDDDTAKAYPLCMISKPLGTLPYVPYSTTTTESPTTTTSPEPTTTTTTPEPTTTTPEPTTTTTTPDPTTTTTTPELTTTTTTPELTTTTTTPEPTTTTTTPEPTTTTTTPEPTTTTTTPEPTTTTTPEPTTTTTTPEPTTTTTTPEPTTTTTTPEPTTTTTTPEPTTTTTTPEPTTTTTTPEPTTTTTTPEPTTTTTTPDPTTTTTTPEPTSTTPEPTTTTTNPEPTTTTTTPEPTTTTTTPEPTTTTTTPEPTTTTTTTPEPTTTTTTPEPTTTTTNPKSTTTAEPTTITTTREPTTTTPQPTTTTPVPTTTTTIPETTTTEPITTSTAEPPTTTKPHPSPTTTTPETIANVEGSKYDRPQTRESFQVAEQVINVLAQLPEADKSAIGYSVDEFMLDCQFSGFLCSPQNDFERIYNGMHGNCYVFNSGWNKTNALQMTKRGGRRFGLQLILNVGQQEYISQSGDLAGALVVIHSQDKMPFPEDEGILAYPGEFTAVGLKKMVISRQSRPYGECMHKDDSSPQLNVYEELYQVNYSKNACLKTCFQQHMIEQCGCADSHYPTTGEAFGSKNISVCDVTNITQDDCAYEITQKYSQNKLECNCLNLCNEQSYLPIISRAAWPSMVQKDEVVQSIATRYPELSERFQFDSTFADNLMKVVVFYEELNYERITESPAYDIGKFMSDIGGILGLWVGFSFMTIFEFVEFFLDLMWFFINRKCMKHRKPTPTNVVEPIPVHSNKKLDKKSKFSYPVSPLYDYERQLPNMVQTET